MEPERRPEQLVASSHGRRLFAVVCVRVHVWQFLHRRRGDGAGGGELWSGATTTAVFAAAAAAAAVAATITTITTATAVAAVAAAVVAATAATSAPAAVSAYDDL